MALANGLLGNDLDAPVIEITLGELTLIAQADLHLGFSGR